MSISPSRTLDMFAVFASYTLEQRRSKYTQSYAVLYFLRCLIESTPQIADTAASADGIFHRKEGAAFVGQLPRMSTGIARTALTSIVITGLTEHLRNAALAPIRAPMGTFAVNVCVGWFLL